MRFTLLSAITVAVCALPCTGNAQPSGRASVTDGDSLEIASQRVRLHGIDAPEWKQRCEANGRQWRCGQAAAQALKGQIGSQRVMCTPRDRDRYGRVVAVCRAGGVELNAWMVAEGWALAYRRYSTAYVDEERAAKAAKRGVWRGRLVAPWEWRRGKRLTGRATSSAKESGQCRIKGNISRKGTRIYHMPGDMHYERTKINTGKGERWFCTQAEAREAGWRRAKH